MREENIWEYLQNRREDDILVDLRNGTAYSFGSVPGAINIPAERVGELYDLPKDRTICLFCQVGELSGSIAELLSDAGYDVCNLTGGYREYLRQSLIHEGDGENG